MLSLLLSLALPAMAGDGEQSLLYDLRMNGKTVGSREVTIRFLPSESGAEVRLIESYTRVETSLLGKPVRFVNRFSGRSGAGFTSSVDENGRIREVQAQRRSDGSWRVTVIEGGKISQGTLLAGQVSLTSVGLLDPVEHRDLTGRPQISLLAAETGTLLSGRVEPLGEGSLEVGGQRLRVDRYAWTSEAGRVELAWTGEGVLASWTSSLLGQPIEGVLRQPPPERSYGTIDLVISPMEGVREQEL